MSNWSIIYPSRRAFEQDDRAAGEHQTRDHLREEPPEVQEQITAARSAAWALITSGAVGRDVNLPGGHHDFRVEIWGNANPQHERPESGPTDGVGVAVDQQERPQPGPPDPEGARPIAEPDVP